MYCTCTARGFTNLATNGGEWWVCAGCHKPTKAWIMGQGDELLNYFRGGPLDGLAYETITLIESPHHIGHIPITEYLWSEEIVTSDKTGRRARVWLHKSSVPEEAPAASSTTTVAGQASNESQNGEGKMPKNTMVDSGNGLLDRRADLKLSRRIVAEQAGISQAQLATIEKGGARVKDEDVANVRAALDALAPQPSPEQEQEQEQAVDPA